MKLPENIKTFDQLLDAKYGKMGSISREKWEMEFEAFKLGIIIEEARKKQKLTQQQLAERCGTNKGYISRIENDASDIRLSTLHRIIQQGLGGKLRIMVEF